MSASPRFASLSADTKRYVELVTGKSGQDALDAWLRCCARPRISEGEVTVHTRAGNVKRKAMRAVSDAELMPKLADKARLYWLERERLCWLEAERANGSGCGR